MTPDDRDTWQVVWTLLLQTANGWVRYPLDQINCGGEVPAGCSHEEMFGRSFTVARRAGRIAVVAPGADGQDPIGAFAMLVEGAPPFTFPVGEPPASAEALLEAGPADLEAAYRELLATHRPFEHATAAADAGAPGPRDLLGGLMASEPDWSCVPLLHALRMRPQDRWVEEQLARPTCAPNLASPTASRALELPQRCVTALARCGLVVDVPLTVSRYDRSERTNAVVLGDEPTLLLGPDFDLFGQVVADPPIFVTDRSCGPDAGLRSRTAIIWLGSEPVTCDRAEAPVVIVPDLLDGAVAPAGVCPIPADACPVL